MPSRARTIRVPAIQEQRGHLVTTVSSFGPISSLISMMGIAQTLDIGGEASLLVNGSSVTVKESFQNKH